jgi:hypothetical protein
MKLPECDLVANSLGTGRTVSVAVALGEPPPDTVTEFTCGELASDATLTVTVMGG